MERNTKGQTFVDLPAIPSRKIYGRCLVWGQLSSDRGGYKVRLMPGSARFGDQTRLIYSHDFKDTFCMVKDGSLKLTADEQGVAFEAELPPTHTADDVLVLLTLNRINGCSFRSENVESRIVREGDQIVEEYLSYDVPEVTITPVPAFEGTWVKVAEPQAQPAPTMAKTEGTAETFETAVAEAPAQPEVKPEPKPEQKTEEAKPEAKAEEPKAEEKVAEPVTDQPAAGSYLTVEQLKKIADEINTLTAEIEATAQKISK